MQQNLTPIALRAASFRFHRGAPQLAIFLFELTPPLALQYQPILRLTLQHAPVNVHPCL